MFSEAQWVAGGAGEKNKSKPLFLFAFFKFGVYFFLEIAQPSELSPSHASSGFVYGQAKCQ